MIFFLLLLLTYQLLWLTCGFVFLYSLLPSKYDTCDMLRHMSIECHHHHYIIRAYRTRLQFPLSTQNVAKCVCRIEFLIVIVYLSRSECGSFDQIYSNLPIFTQFLNQNVRRFKRSILTR